MLITQLTYTSASSRRPQFADEFARVLPSALATVSVISVIHCYCFISLVHFHICLFNSSVEDVLLFASFFGAGELDAPYVFPLFFVN